MFQEIYDKKLCEGFPITFTVMVKKDLIVAIAQLENGTILASDINTPEELDKTFMDHIHDSLDEMGLYHYGKNDECYTAKEKVCGDIDPDIVVKIPAKKTIKAKIVPIEGTISVKEMLKESVDIVVPIQTLDEIFNNSNIEKVFPEPIEEKPYKDEQGYFQGGQPIIEGKREPVIDEEMPPNLAKPIEIIIPTNTVPKPSTNEIDFSNF